MFIRRACMKETLDSFGLHTDVSVPLSLMSIMASGRVLQPLFLKAAHHGVHIPPAHCASPLLAGNFLLMQPFRDNLSMVSAPKRSRTQVRSCPNAMGETCCDMTNCCACNNPCPRYWASPKSNLMSAHHPSNQSCTCIWLLPQARCGILLSLKPYFHMCR